MNASLRSRIYRLWVPLALTWVMMGAEQPLVTALVARMPNPLVNLAAYGLAIALLMLCESPIFGIISASIAIVEDRESFRRLRSFSHVNSGCLSALVFLLSTGAVFGVVIEPLVDITPELSELVRRALFITTPVPFAVGYRRFYQGILVRAGRGRAVAFGTFGRFFALVISGTVLFQRGTMTGVELGASSLCIGMVFEAILARLMVVPQLRELALKTENLSGRDLSFSGLSRFYYPYALSTVISLSLTPLVSLFLVHSARPLESLALYPVLAGVLTVFRSPSFAYQEAVVAVMSEDPRSDTMLKRVAYEIGIGSTVLLSLLLLGPLRSWWFSAVAGLSPELVAMSFRPALNLTAGPLLAALVCYNRGYLIARKKTILITASGLLEIGTTGACMWLGVFVLGGVGIVVSSTAQIVTWILSASFLSLCRRMDKEPA